MKCSQIAVQITSASVPVEESTAEFGESDRGTIVASPSCSSDGSSNVDYKVLSAVGEGITGASHFVRWVKEVGLGQA